MAYYAPTKGTAAIYAAYLSKFVGLPSRNGPGRTVTKFIVETYALPHGKYRVKNFNCEYGVVERWTYNDRPDLDEFGGAFVDLSFDGYNPNDLRIYHVLCDHGGSTRMVLNLEPQNMSEVKQAISWQITGGAKRDSMSICVFEPGTSKFWDISTGEEYEVSRSPYTVKAWREFCSRLGLPDLD